MKRFFLTYFVIIFTIISLKSALSAPYLGDFVEDETVHFTWSTNDSSGAAITRSANGTILVFKDNATSGTTKGITDTKDFNSITGVHACTINTLVSSFYVTGANYSVVLDSATVDAQTVSGCLANFSIVNRYRDVNVTEVGGEAVTGGTPPITASETASAVWDALAASYNTASTFGSKNQIAVPSATLNDYKADVSGIPAAILAATLDGAISVQTGLQRILAVTVNNCAVTIADPNVMVYKDSAGTGTVVTHSIPKNGTSRTATF